MSVDGIFVDAVAESGRNSASKYQTLLSVDNEQAGAG